MKIAILGYGDQGRSAYEYWKDGNDITICEQNADVKAPEGLELRTGPDHLKNLEAYDLIVRSPIVHPRDIAEANSPDILAKVTTVTNEFFKVSPTKNIIGVTGTKGKGTTSTLIAELLEAQGKRVHLGGNIGIPPLDMLKSGIQPEDWVVLELANFQLIDLRTSPRIAVCLMVVPEHLDWHMDVDEYIESKTGMFKHQKPEDIAIYFAGNDNSQKIASSSPGKKIPYFKKPGAFIRGDGMLVLGEDEREIIHKNKVKLLGEHNLQNICAALTAVFEAAVSLDPGGIVRDSGIPRGRTRGASFVKAVGGSTWVDKAESVLSSFSGLEHRLELVRAFQGVSYYDDSFGTTPETAIVAMKAFKAPKIMILGGSEKGADFGELADEIMKNNVKHAITIGPTGEKIAILLKNRGFTSITEGLETMPQIVDAAKKAASTGDVVLLSTGSASFGLFKNYKDRGEQFKKAVLNLS